MKTVQQQETEAILSMARTIENLTQQVKELTARVERAERNQFPTNPAPYNPSTPYGPLNPNPWVQPWPSYPPYTITCKMADGTTQEIPAGPAYATTNG